MGANPVSHARESSLGGPAFNVTAIQEVSRARLSHLLNSMWQVRGLLTRLPAQAQSVQEQSFFGWHPADISFSFFALP